MFVRRLVLSLFLGALLAGSIAGASAGGGFKFLSYIDPIPPLLKVALPVTCQLSADKNTYFTCTATAPNPDPPKDRETVKFTVDSPKASCKLTAYPDGGVVIRCTLKGLVF